MKLGSIPGGDTTLPEPLGTVEHMVALAEHNVGRRISPFRWGRFPGHQILLLCLIADWHTEGAGTQGKGQQ